MDNNEVTTALPNVKWKIMDADVQYYKKEDAQNEWREFINKYFDIPCTIIANWNVGIYDLKERKWIERYDKEED